MKQNSCILEMADQSAIPSSQSEIGNSEIPIANSEVTAHVLEPFDCALDASDESAGEKMLHDAYQKGLADGLRQAEQGKTFQAADALACAVEQLQAEFSPAAEQARRAEILELSLAIARRVVMGEMKTNPGVVGEVVSALLSEAEGRKVFAVRLHPDDVERLKQSPGAMERLEKAKIALHAAPEIKPGGVILETGFGKLDARLETRLDELAAVLLGETASAGNPPPEAEAQA
jgi:flagellar biosynthesis/type III secretory pathway protein FliH